MTMCNKKNLNMLVMCCLLLVSTTLALRAQEPASGDAAAYREPPK